MKKKSQEKLKATKNRHINQFNNYIKRSNKKQKNEISISEYFKDQYFKTESDADLDLYLKQLHK